MATLKELREVRVQKLKKLRDLGIDPYPAKSQKDYPNKEITDNFKKYEGKEITLAGRIMSWRGHGKLWFADLTDASGKIQLYLKVDNLEAETKDGFLGYKNFDLLDVGDFVQATGKVTKTERGEISLEVTKLRLLAKALRPLPEKWEGLKDKEVRFRRRYLDMVMNPDVREVFKRKAKFWEKAREFMREKGFVEIETPILEHVTGGADARPFVTHHNALDQDFYLRISSELFQKRVIGGGFEKVFVLGPNFRNEGIDDEHLQEFYQLEWYWAYSDISNTIALTQELYKYLVKEVYGKTKFSCGKYTFDFADKWEVVDYVKAVKEKFNVDVFKTSLEEIYEILKKEGVEIEFEDNRNRLVDNLMKLIRKDIAGPASLINHPKFISPLAKSDPENPKTTERFQPIIAGSEMGNAYSELNNPLEQYERFKQQQEMRNKGDEEAQMMDIDFVEMLEYGMPPTSSIGFSERLFWVLEGLTAREGTLFPQMKQVIEESTKEIYDIEEPRRVSTQIVSRFSDSLNKLRNQIVASDLEEIEESRLIKVDKELLKKYENVNVGVAVIKGVKIEKENEGLEQLKKKVVRLIESSLSAEEIDDIPQIESYFKMYQQMGVDTRSRRSSPEALLRRIVEGEELYNVNTCVDAYNLAVILTQVSAGAFDLAKIKFPVEVREAKKGEKIEIIGGEVKKLKQGEVCYFDKEGAYNMDYNYRDAERTKVTEGTKDLWINAEGVNEISREQVADALKLAVDLMTRYCGGEAEKMGMVKV